MGNACTPMADSCQCMAKPIQYCKVKKKKKRNASWEKKKVDNQKKKYIYIYMCVCVCIDLIGHVEYSWPSMNILCPEYSWLRSLSSGIRQPLLRISAEYIFLSIILKEWCFETMSAFLLVWSVKNLPCRRPRFKPWVRRSFGEGNGNPLQYSCLGNPMDEEPGWLQPMRL